MHNIDVHTEGLAQAVRQTSRQRAEIRRDQPPYRNRGLIILLLAVASWGVVFGLYSLVRFYF